MLNIPLYQKIYQDILKQIQSGQLSPNSQVPTEKELSEKYSVSRITSKRALSELEQQGKIYRQQGKGSFVAEVVQNCTVSNKRILFVLPFANDLSLGNFNEGIQFALAGSDTDFLLTSMEFLNKQNAQTIIETFNGLIYYVDQLEAHFDFLFELEQQNFPVVTLDKKLHEFSFPVVLSDNFQGGVLATEHLIRLKHLRIGYIFGNSNHPQSVRQRYLGYIDSLQKAHLVFRTKLDDPQANLANALNYIWVNRLTAVVCENDIVAIELMQLLKSNDYRLPQNFSIVGFDDIQAAQFVDPSLTTIAQNFYQLGMVAGEKLLSLMQNQLTCDAKIPVSLIPRQSTLRMDKSSRKNS